MNRVVPSSDKNLNPYRAAIIKARADMGTTRKQKSGVLDESDQGQVSASVVPRASKNQGQTLSKI